MQNRIISFTSKASNSIIYQSKKLSWYVWLLVLSKFLRCSGLYLAFDVIKTTHVINFVWTLSLICTILFGVVQKPFSSGQKISSSTWLKIGRFSFVQNCVLILLYYGLSQVGPYRAALLTQHSDIVLLTVFAAIFKGTGGPRKLRGSLCFILSILALILFDNDSSIIEHPEGQSHHGIKHVIFYVISWMGLSDHEGGLLMLLLTAVLMMSLNSRSKSLCLEVGGAKRFNAFSWLVSFILLTPCVLLFWIMKVSSPVDALSSFHLIFIIALLYVVFHYYVNMTCNQKLTPAKASQIGTITLLLSSLVLGFVWPQREQEFHRVSGGAVFSLILFSIATMQLTSSSEFMTLDQDDLLPFHYFSTDVLERSPSFFAFMNSTFHTVMTDPNSRIIFYFLCINLGFTFVELSYGMFTNSLGLISDGFHMLFDCSALVMGLTASVMTQWKPTKKFPFGYGRIEVLSGFVNGLFLSVIGLMVFVEAVERLLEPPPIRTERLLAVAVCGLVVNLCGIFAFSSHSHGHSHGGGSHSHGGSHGHSHHGHSHAQKSSHGHSHNANMEGVFLHILADTLGSVAVIISSFLIDWYGWLIADPICSLILSVLILASVFPLLKNSALVLLLGAPPHLQEGVRPVIDKILEIESVLKCESPHFWRHCDNITVATINVCISGDIPEQKIMQKVSSILQDFGFSHIMVEIEVSKSTSNWVSTAPSSHGLGTIIKSVPKNQNEDFFSI